MGEITNFIEEAAGAFAADKALEAVDPNAGMLAKAAAAVAGFGGVGKVKEMLGGDGNADANNDADAPAPSDDSQS